MKEFCLGFLGRERTEQAKALRKANGDKGAKFSTSKQPKLRVGGVCPTITSVLKDSQIMTVKCRRLKS